MHDSRLHDGDWEENDMRLFNRERARDRREQEYMTVIAELMAAAYVLKLAVNHAANAMQADDGDDAGRDAVVAAYTTLRDARSTFLLMSRRAYRALPRQGELDTMARNMADSANKLMALIHETLDGRGVVVEDGGV